MLQLWIIAASLFSGLVETMANELAARTRKTRAAHAGSSRVASHGTPCTRSVKAEYMEAIRQSFQEIHVKCRVCKLDIVQIRVEALKVGHPRAQDKIVRSWICQYF